MRYDNFVKNFQLDPLIARNRMIRILGSLVKRNQIGNKWQYSTFHAISMKSSTAQNFPLAILVLGVE
jgi:hypothetical protein